ncbi:cobalamin adenosyltransferase [Anaerococcus sp. WCA-380-WT-2B]|uniref:Cobalamin adenosyltransferase n=1 Tax=Anaerococcus porci TaxID=2652269 RepID=A0A6N7VVE8_9FIRM|nr:cobalamin adenosyltransferase [Anaerococcus porci]MSS77659.1 cobalamin adenosyltransferase [Anaerococcus porci]
MLFITEDKLRNQYKKSPFDSYLLKKGNKLTPQARQFLIDFRIKIINEENPKPIKKKEDLKIEDKVFKDKKYIKKVLILKELALDIREFDQEFALIINQYALDFYKKKEIKIDQTDISKDEAIEIYIKLDLISPYLRAFTSINKAIEKLEEIHDDDVEKISSILYDWFINISKGG